MHGPSSAVRAGGLRDFPAANSFAPDGGDASREITSGSRHQFRRRYPSSPCTVREAGKTHPMHTHPTIRRFCRAKMTHLGRRCPAICNVRRSPPGSPRRRTLRFSDGDCTGSWSRCRSRNAPRAWLRHLAGCRSAPGGRIGADRPSKRARRHPGQGFERVIRKNGLRKSRRTGDPPFARVWIGSGGANRIRGDFGADRSSLTFRHRANPSSATSNLPHPGSRGDSHAPPAFSTVLHSG